MPFFILPSVARRHSVTREAMWRCVASCFYPHQIEPPAVELPALVDNDVDKQREDDRIAEILRGQQRAVREILAYILNTPDAQRDQRTSVHFPRLKTDADYQAMIELLAMPEVQCKHVVVVLENRETATYNEADVRKVFRDTQVRISISAHGMLRTDLYHLVSTSPEPIDLLVFWRCIRPNSVAFCALDTCNDVPHRMRRTVDQFLNKKDAYEAEKAQKALARQSLRDKGHCSVPKHTAERCGCGDEEKTVIWHGNDAVDDVRSEDSDERKVIYI